MKTSLKDKFIATISENKMLKKNDSVLIALSGGADSTVMTSLFNGIKDIYNLKLYAFHLDHLIRKKEAKRDAEFVKALCERFSIKSYIREYDVKEHAKKSGQSVQAAARDIRYKMLFDIKKKLKIDKIATAHNADDRAETVLIRLIRGTAGANIAGISPVRDSCIIRPLIDCAKDEIRKYAKEQKLGFVEDSSNRETDYLRNSVRLKLIPYLKKNYNKNISENLINFSKVKAIENEFLNKKVKVKYESCLIKRTNKELIFSIKKLSRYDKALVNRIITAAYYELALAGHSITNKHVVKVSYMIVSDKPNLSYRLPGGMTVLRSYEELKFTSSNISTFTSYKLEHSLKDVTEINEAKVKVSSKLVSGKDILKSVNRKKDNEEYLDYDKLTFPVTIRCFKPGDTINPLNMKGTKKLKDIFIDKKVPVSIRRSVPIIVSGGDIALVHGISVSDRFKVTTDTKSAVKFSLIKG